MARSEHFSGPLPHPKILNDYNNIVPGSANRIINKFEEQTYHRHKLENRVIWVDSVKSILGLISAFTITMTTIIGGIYSALNGQNFLGGTLSFTGPVALVFVFIKNNLDKNK